MKTIHSEALKKHFSFLPSIFKLKEIKSYNYALYAKFLSSSVGIYFVYEFRDYIPDVQLTKLETDELKPRPGLYTIKEWYKDESFVLHSFYLSEIILFKEGEEYIKYFKDVKTIEDAIKITAELIEKYATDFVAGDNESYGKINAWLRDLVMKSE